MKKYEIEIMWDGEIYLDIVYGDSEEEALEKARERVEQKITYNVNEVSLAKEVLL